MKDQTNFGTTHVRHDCNHMKDPRTDKAVDQLPEAPISDRESYPGSEATVGQLLGVANEYAAAAYALLSQADQARWTRSAPVRLCAIHAVEMYLNAFLIFHDMSPKQVRGLQHDLAQRTVAATQRGLSLRAKTQVHLLRIHDQREYLVVRYGPEQVGGLSELNRMFATLKEVSAKVTTAIMNQPYAQADPRFKVYW